MTDARPGPAVVALGGGHGLAAALAAVRRYAGHVTAVVSVADDGGSSGRLRRELGLPPPGDLRKCLVALAEPGSVWSAAFEHRFSGGHLDGHALGNLIIAGLAEELGDFAAAVDEAGRLLGVRGRVVPATAEPVVLKADVDGEPVEGQVAVAQSSGRIRHVELVPGDPPAHPEAVRAIREADQVVLAPGSLFTSLVPVLCVPEVAAALRETDAPVVMVCNLRPQIPETKGLDGHDHLAVVLERIGRVDAFVYQPGTLAVDEEKVVSLRTRPVAADLGDPAGEVHDAAKLAAVLSSLLAPSVP